MIIALLRHGQSQANAQSLLSSLPADACHLTDLGKQQIRDLKQGQFFALPPAALYSSPFYRTLESAAVIQKHILPGLDVPLVVDPRISEMGYGLYSGKTISETDVAVRETFRRSLAGDFIIKMSETGESRKQFFVRTYSFIATLLNQYQDDQKVLVITHSSVMAVLEKLWIKLVNPSFVRESTKNAQLKLLAFKKSDAKLIQQEINKLLLEPEYGDAQYMQCTGDKLLHFIPAVDYKGYHGSVLVFSLGNSMFYEVQLADIKPTELWFAGYLSTVHLFADTPKTQAVFAQQGGLVHGPTADDAGLDFVADYCRRFYPGGES